MEESILGKLAAALRGMGGAVQDPQFRSDVVGRLADALRGSVADVFPTGAGPIVSRNMGVPADPNYRNKMTDLGLAGLTVYHGSPYKFDKFDMSKVGTGEGAQAYGHGLYFAENPGVAKQYAENLSGKSGGAYLTADAAPPEAISILNRKISGYFIPHQQNGMTPQQIYADVLERTKAENKWATEYKLKQPPEKQTPYIDETRLRTENELKLLNKINPNSLQENAGNFYRVDLPDDQIAKMLDWDAPLSKQPEAVQTALSKKFPEYFNNGWMDAKSGNPVPNAKAYGLSDQELNARGFVFGSPAQSMTGEQFYRDLASKGVGDMAFQKGGHVNASQSLRDLSIPGIRYLDQGSRGAGKGTSNFVVFSDDLPKIIGRE